MSNRERLMVHTPRPLPYHGLGVLRPGYKNDEALEIASRLVFHKNDRECIIIGSKTLRLTPNYLRGVRGLDPLRRTEHIIKITDSLKKASAVVYEIEH